MNRRHLAAAALLMMISFVAVTAQADAADFLFPGIQAKAAAGAGQTVSRGGTALFFNPANMILSSGLDAEVDASLATISYSYQNADDKTFSPAVLTTTTPLATAAIAYRAATNLALGLALFPLGLGAPQSDAGIPVEVTPNTYEALDLVQKQTAFKTAAGGAWQIASFVTLGAGVIYYNERTETTLTPAGKSDALLIAKYSGASFQEVLGLRAEARHKWAAALTYKTAATRPYSGSVDTNTASTNAPAAYQTADFHGVGYDPATLGLGADGRLGNIALFVDYVREFWSNGRSIYKQGLGSDSPQIDFVDTDAYTAGAKWLVAPQHMVQAALSMATGNTGFGDQEVGNDKPGVGGVKVGTFAAIPRMVYAGGYRFSAASSYVELSLLYLSGTLSVPKEHAQAGTFQLTEAAASIGAGCSF